MSHKQTQRRRMRLVAARRAEINDMSTRIRLAHTAARPSVGAL